MKATYKNPSLNSLAKLQLPQNLHEDPRLAELGASLCLTAAFSSHLGHQPVENNCLRAGLAAAVLNMVGSDKQKNTPRASTNTNRETPPHQEDKPI